MDETGTSIDGEPETQGFGDGGDPFAERSFASGDIPALLSGMKGAKIFTTDKKVEVHLPVRTGPPFTIVVGRGATDREALTDAFAKRSARETAFFC